MRTPIIISAILLTASSFSQKMTPDEYIRQYSEMAIEEMKSYGIPASITLAQGILESGTGNSELARKANNHFGIKCHKGWQGKTYHMDDDSKNECFRKYASPGESYRDHSLFLTSRDRYAFLFDLEISDYKGWARGLKKAGYATNPRYAEMLIRIIEENELYRFDSDAGSWQSARLRYASDGQAVGSRQSDSTKADYEYGAPFEAELIEKGGNGRNIFENNKVKFVYAREGDTWETIAREFGIYGWQVRKYNELDRKEELIPGEVIYIEKKRNRARQEFHIAGEGETMRNISQRYAVKLNVLYRKNGMDKGQEPAAGTRMILK